MICFQLFSGANIGKSKQKQNGGKIQMYDLRATDLHLFLKKNSLIFPLKR